MVLKPPLQQFYPNFPLILDKLSWKTVLLVKSEFLGVFGNTLTGDQMYSGKGCEKIQEHVQTLLSQNRKIFS